MAAPERPATVRIGVIVEGGGLSRSWALPSDSIVEAGGVQFFTASRSLKALKKFLAINGGTHTWGVFDMIAFCREKAVQDMCAKLLMDDDPMASASEQRLPTKEDLKAMKLTMPASVLVDIPSSGGCAGHTMRVLTTVVKSTKVAFEISGSNFKWLYEAVQLGNYVEVPRNASKSRTKLGDKVVSACANVHWREKRKTLWTSYLQGGKKKTLSRRVSSCSDEDREATIIAREAEKLQHRRDSMHEPPPRKGRKVMSSASTDCSVHHDEPSEPSADADS